MAAVVVLLLAALAAFALGAFNLLAALHVNWIGLGLELLVMAELVDRLKGSRRA